MMSWAAANAPKARSSIEKRAEEAGTTGVPTSPKKRRATETVEAALSRLSKAYTTSMECIGALNKTNQMLQKEAIVSDEQLAVLERVSNAARKSLENGILLDPLVLMHVPTLNMTMQNFASGDEGSSLSMDRWESVKEKRPQPPTLSSAAHKSTIRELTYLALVNYADLLLSCCVFKMDDSSQEEKRRNISILDRGVVRKLHVLNDKNHNCWRGESHEDTQRLAVTALCDASNLDGSDPTLWLKLASASRGLENLVVKDDDPSTLVTKYRRLQRYALERGSKALPPQMPPNRTVTRALNEINSEPEPESYRPSFVSDTETMKLTFELPRYSWSMLGRFLTKACREGSDFQQPFHRQHHRSQFGSPAVELHLSPMLVLPARVLGRVCLFLENSSIWRFEATCRALSVSIMSARASMEKESGAEKAPPTKPNNKADNERATDNLAESTAPATDTATTAVSEQGGTRADATVDVPNGTAEQENLEGFSETQTSRRNSRPNVPAHLCRTSKRLRSQQITSGKKSERSWKRKSFDYCFLASTLSTTRHQHQENMKTLPSALLAPRSAYRSDLLVGRGNTRNDSNDSRDVHNREALERISGSSLPAFVELWNGRNSGPLDLLTNYLIHVANNVEDVFASDPSGAVVLASCLLGCFQILKRKAGYQQGFTYSIFQPTTKTRSMFRSLNLFATDLLHAELILRQCDRYSPVHVEFDDDSNQISIMVPTLLEACEEMEKVISEDVDTKLKARVEKRFDLLKVRCYWLAAGFYLWRSRISRMIWEAREAEDEGIDYILEAKKCFESPALGRKKIIFTPHLVSPGRTEQHWKEISFETLTKVRDDLQASSVVSLARQKFLDLVGSIEREQSKRILGANDTEEKEAGEEAKRTDGNSQDYADRNKLSEADTKALAEIGEILLERYSFPYGDSEAKHAELVDDFLACHGDNISILAGIDTDERMQKLQGILPLGETNALDLMGMANPSIFTMLTICLRMKTENRSKSFELMVHLVMTSIDIHNSLIQRILDAKAIQRRGGTGNEDFSDSEDESVMSDDDSIDRDAANKDADAKKARQCCHLVSVLIERIGVEFSDYMSKEEQSTTLSSKDTATTIRSAMILSSNLFQTNIKRLSLPEDGSDQSLFKSVRTLISRLCVSADETVRRELQLEFFNLSVEAFLLQRQYLESLVSSQSQRTGRAARQKQCIKRAEFIRMLGGELGNMLSQNLGKVKGFQMTRSDFLRLKSNGDGDIGRKEWEFSDLKLHMLVDSLLSLWKYVSKVDSDVANAGKNQAPMCSSFDKPVIKELRVAIASLIVGLCGSATSTRSKSRTTANRENEDVAGDGVDDSETTDQLDLTEFFDSDASAVDWASDSSSDVNKDRKELLRSICHAVHCISQVLEWIDDKEALSLPISQGNYTFGPVLPLVTVRVLNHFADIILLNFEDEEVVAAPSVWTEKFPSRTETVGELLDSNLHKAYRWLYGFVLVGDKAHYSSGIGKDTVASTVAPLTELSAKSTVPESTTAAAQLYRCIVRAYSSGRRSPPKTSLELVSSALPPLEESEKSRSLRDFLFTSYGHNYFSLDDVVRVVKKEEGWLSPFENIRGHLGVDTTPYDPVIAEEEEAISVRRGISSQLAKGPLPAFTTDSGKNKSDTTPEDDRSATVRFEKELSKKFFAILEDICLGGIQQGAEGWYRAAQCLTMKAELIADRLGFSRGFSRSTDFVSPESRPSSNRGWDLAQLEAEQEHEAKMREQNSVPYLGNDLSVYMRYAWSSFASLKNCSSVIAAQKSLSEIEGVVLREIDSFHDSRDYLEWQEAWGGIFISALRKLSLRFLCVALYETHSGNTTGKEDNVLKSELRETTGIALYTELMASQKYGYPMREIVPKMKRDIAAASKECFQAAVDILDSSTMDDDTDGRATWDLLFMIGKCEEKIAKTYRKESFARADGGTTKTRLYEKSMASALKKYSDAYAQAKIIEDDGGFIVDQSGGSAHGSTELLYRLLASRLKCLIAAVSIGSEYLKEAEEEALRLTECHWFSKSAGADQQDDAHIRDRVWKVLADVVSGLAQCRMNQHYFHRSVYRHAQALMWAPTLYDPTQSEGSLGEVPGTKGYQIRGLNNSTHAADSAEVILSCLFDRRRPQLAAVWVTHTTASSPFQILNSSTRKYDSLRGKYIMAYLETLRLCQRRPKLETFLKWTSVTKRDLPNYFQASSITGGNLPPKQHMNDNLLEFENKVMSRGFLITVKRQANSALAYVVQKQIDDASDKMKSSSEPDKRKAVHESNLKHAYACYLRLHCTKDDLKKHRAFSYGGDTIREVDTLCNAYLALGDSKKFDNTGFGDWSGGARKSSILDAALGKCRILFPSTSGSFFSKKLTTKSKRGVGDDDAGDDDDLTSPSKRKQPGQGKRVVSYEVAVPESLEEGDTFLTAVKVGGATQKVKLTVPKGSPSTLRFKLTTPTKKADDGSSPPQKKAKNAVTED